MSRLLRSRSGTESPRSLDNMRNRQVSSPMRTSGSVSHDPTFKLDLSEANILLILSRVPQVSSSSCVDSGDEASLRIDRGTYQYMFQDIVSIKTMLLKLKRVLQEVRRCITHACISPLSEFCTSLLAIVSVNVFHAFYARCRSATWVYLEFNSSLAHLRFTRYSTASVIPLLMYTVHLCFY